LDHLGAVRQKFMIITDRFASSQAQWLNVHVDFPLVQRIALPITIAFHRVRRNVPKGNPLGTPGAATGSQGAQP
jgi:hypothetical protein